MKHNQHHHNQNHPPVQAPTPAAEITANEINFSPSPDEVARRAYFAYENQGSKPGHEVQHWLKAEAELLAERTRTRTHARYTALPTEPGEQRGCQRASPHHVGLGHHFGAER